MEINVVDDTEKLNDFSKKRNIDHISIIQTEPKQIKVIDLDEEDSSDDDIILIDHLSTKPNINTQNKSFVSFGNSNINPHPLNKYPVQPLYTPESMNHRTLHNMHHIKPSFNQSIMAHTPNLVLINPNSNFRYQNTTNTIHKPSNTTRPKRYVKDVDTELDNDEDMFEKMQDYVSSLQEEPQPDTVKTTLLFHQKQALWWMVQKENSRTHGGIIADDMGLGKSLQILSLCSRKISNATGPSLIICPTSILSHWPSEIKKHLVANHASHVIYYGNNRKKNKGILNTVNFVITTYGTLVSEFKEHTNSISNNSYSRSPLFTMRWERIILDEAHIIKNKSTYTANACFELKANYRWCLTDPSYWKTLVNKIFSKNKEGCKAFYELIKEILLRRRKDQKINGVPIMQLPKMEIIIEKVVMEEEEKLFYEYIEDSLMKIFQDYMKEGDKFLLSNYMHILTLLLNMRLCCDHPYLVILSSERRKDENVKSIDHEKYESIFQQIVNDLKKGKVTKAFAPISSLNDSEICPICGNEIEHLAITPCNHLFCQECIIRHIDYANACFTCGDSLNTSQIKISEKIKTNLSNINFKSDEDEDIFLKNPVKNEILSQSEPDIIIIDDNNSSSIKVDYYSIMSSSEEEFKRRESEISDAIKELAQNMTKTNFRESAKLKLLIKQLIETRDRDPTCKSLVISQFTSFLDFVEKLLLEHNFVFVRLDGTMSQVNRMKAIERFNNDADTTVFLISLRVGALGLNLTSATQLFMLDPWWNPAVEQQAYDRIHRLGQTKEVKVYRYLAENTVEERIEKIQERKRELSQHALSDKKGSNLSKLTLEDIKLLFNVSRK